MIYLYLNTGSPGGDLPVFKYRRGRHNGTLMEHRLCTHCESRNNVVIEDEYHFLLCCPKYRELRDMYIDPVYHTNVTFEKFTMLMSSNDCNTLRNLALFVYHAFKLIKGYVKSHTHNNVIL